MFFICFLIDLQKYYFSTGFPNRLPFLKVVGIGLAVRPHIFKHLVAAFVRHKAENHLFLNINMQLIVVWKA